MTTKTQTPDYTPLLRVLSLAYEQASAGKGYERHANGRDFDRQPILEYGRVVGPAGTAFQAMKKTGEALGMVKREEHGAAVRELLGAIVYNAATVMLVEEAGPMALPHMPERMLFDHPPAPPAAYPPMPAQAETRTPSPIKQGEPCVRITEESWNELHKQNDELFKENEELTREVEQTTKKYDQQSKFVATYVKALRQVVARCSQARSTPLSRSIIDALAKGGEMAADLDVAIKAVYNDQRANTYDTPPMPLPSPNENDF